MPSPSYDIEVGETPTTKTPETAPPKETATPPKKAYRLLTLQKTECFGNCPEYEFILMSNGEATYIGKKNVPRIGKYKAQSNAGFLFYIKNKYRDGNFFKLQESYPTNGKFIKELPDTYLMFQYDDYAGQQILIRNNHNAPKELLDFQKWIEGMIEELQWSNN